MVRKTEQTLSYEIENLRQNFEIYKNSFENKSLKKNNC